MVTCLGFGLWVGFGFVACLKFSLRLWVGFVLRHWGWWRVCVLCGFVQLGLEFIGCSEILLF